jgi:hypothetical protein
MSLCRIAIRRACVLALKGRTLAGDNVLDSEIGAVDTDKEGNLSVSGEGRFIAVYTDQAQGGSGMPGALYENGDLLVRIEFGITERMVVEEEDPDNPGEMIRSVVSGIPFTSAAAETYLDLVGRQVISALSHPENEAADVFRGLFQSGVRIDRRRESDDKGQAVAAQQIALTGTLLPDPIGLDDVPAGAPFARLLALLDSGTDHDQRIAALMRDELKAVTEPWELAQERLGRTMRELLGVGLGPIAGDIDREAPEMTEAVFGIPGHGETVLAEPSSV